MSVENIDDRRKKNRIAIETLEIALKTLEGDFSYDVWEVRKAISTTLKKLKKKEFKWLEKSGKL